MEKRQLNLAYIGLGSNLNNPEKQVRTAFVEINAIPSSKVVSSSKLYQNPPLGNLKQDDYINAVLALETPLTASELLIYLQQIELKHDRKRSGEKWSARTLDLDILLYNNDVISTHDLQIPHYDLKNRYFYLYALSKINPNLVFPDGHSISEVITHCIKTVLVPL